MPEEDLIDKAVRLHSEALAEIDAGRLDCARSLATESLTLFERESGASHPDLANVLNCLAQIAHDRAEYAEAASCSRRALEIMRSVRQQAEGADIDRLYVQTLTRAGDVTR